MYILSYDSRSEYPLKELITYSNEADHSPFLKTFIWRQIFTVTMMINILTIYYNDADFIMNVNLTL